MPARRNSKPSTRSKSRGKSTKKRFWPWLIGILILLILAGGIWHYRLPILYYFSFISKHKAEKDESALTAVRTLQVIQNHQGKPLGFDVSEYQGNIQWNALGKVEGDYPLEFVFIRSTAGKDRVDKKFEDNWIQAKDAGLLRGAYHYYRPNENSLEQAANFILNTPLRKGDLPPVLDIEELPKNQSKERLKLGLQRWLDAVEKHYGVRPIIYSGQKYYESLLSEEFSDYTFWIANYNFFVERMQPEWTFWQFTESAEISGIQGEVDLNIFNGPKERLEYFRME